ncbi:hypothetical protein ACFVIM_09230 [Streptomyces sp. NPDC057638]|uniref:hypothetical protein n=1 Tax=Streptomyces sp. NPDC057638 TaxID=3346190 RepID=UPI0036A5ABFD
MDDLTALRRMREDAPVPDRVRLVAARRPLMDAMTGGARRRRPLGRALKILGAVAAVTATAVLVTLVGPVEEGRVSAASAPFAPEREPRGDAWLYRAYLNVSTPGLPGATRPSDPAPPRSTESSESWNSYGGTAVYVREQQSNSLRGYKLDGPNILGSPRKLVRELARLPGDPEELLDALGRAIPISDTWGGSRARADYRRLWLVLSQVDGVPHGVRTAMVRTLRTIPGVVITEDVEDAMGRSAIAVYDALAPKDRDVERTELLLAPKTYEMRSMRSRLSDTTEGTTAPRMFERVLIKSLVVPEQQAVREGQDITVTPLTVSGSRTAGGVTVSG